MNKTLWLVLAVGFAISGCSDDATAPNSAPQISSGPAAAQTTISENQTTIVSVTATDSDGDELTYAWSSDGGTIEGSGSLVVFQPGDVSVQTVQTVSVTVSDGKGGSVTGSADVTVNPTVVIGATYRVRLNSLTFAEADCDGFFDDDLEAFWNLQAGGVTSVRTSGDYLTATTGQIVAITTAWAEVDVLLDGTGAVTVTGDLLDYDASSGDDLIGRWNLSYDTNSIVPGDFTISGGNPEGEGCTVLLKFTIEFVDDVYGSAP